jgi:hypothetical protein
VISSGALCRFGFYAGEALAILDVPMPINRPPERLVTATRLHPARGIVILGRFVRAGFHS